MSHLWPTLEEIDLYVLMYTLEDGNSGTRDFLELTDRTVSDILSIGLIAKDEFNMDLFLMPMSKELLNLRNKSCLSWLLFQCSTLDVVRLVYSEQICNWIQVIKGLPNQISKSIKLNELDEWFKYGSAVGNRLDYRLIYNSLACSKSTEDVRQILQNGNVNICPTVPIENDIINLDPIEFIFEDENDSEPQKEAAHLYNLRQRNFQTKVHLS